MENQFEHLDYRGIHLDGIVSAPAAAIISANSQMAIRQVEFLLDVCFTKDGDSNVSDLQKQILEAISKLERLVDNDFRGKDADINPLRRAVLSIQEPENDDKSDFHGKEHGALHPKMVTIKYPQNIGGKANETIDVQVPLITLVSLSTSQIEELNLKIGLEIMLDGDELVVSFQGDVDQEGPATSSTNGDSPNKGYLEIKVNPKTPPEGLRKLVQGYERVLRAQLPH